MASSLEIAPALGHGIVTAQDQPGGYDAIDDRRQWGVGRQEGALAALAYKVTSKSEGANLSVDVATDGGHFLVQGDEVDWQGLYLVPATVLKANLDLADTPDITNPRLDQVVLEARDHAHTGDGITRGQVYVLSGTPTAGATLDNRSGAAALPASTALLADVLVPASATSITSAEIRDRRAWATGEMVYDVSAASSLDIPVDSTVDRFLTLEWECEFSGLAEFRVYPENIVTASYSFVVGGWGENSTPASFAVGPAGEHSTNNGMRLARAPQGSASGGVRSIGEALFLVRPQVSARLLKAHSVVSSTNGSGNHVVESQQIASFFNSAAVLSYVRLAPNTGTFTGRIVARRR